MKNFSLRENITLTRQKVKYNDFARAINCTYTLTQVCMRVRSHASQGTVCYSGISSKQNQ